MTEYLNQIVTFLGDNPELAGLICFLIAMGEALFIVGLFVPSTVVLVGAGALAGLGKLDPLSIFLWTTLGAIAGDAISYWVGYFYKDRLRNVWPLSRYTSIMERGEAFFRLHGGKSVFIGRFVPGVKSVVPGIAGMVGMDAWYFTFVNVTSAIAWAVSHLGPGFIAGTALSAIGEVSGRLAVMLGVLCVILFVVIMLGRWLIQIIMPLFAGTHGAIIGWFARRPGPVSKWVARSFDPQHPRSTGMLASALLLIITMPAFFWLVTQLTPGDTLTQADLAIRNLFESLRSPLGDRILVPITMLGDGFLLTIFALLVAAYLFGRKAWRRGTGFLIAVSTTALFVPLMKALVVRERPNAFGDGVHGFSFPSGHTTVTTVIFGIIAVLIAHERSAWSKAGIFTITAIYVLTMAFSRVYLGVHWTSDVLAGLLFGTAMVAAFAFVFGHVHNEKVGRGVLAAIVASAFVVFGGWHITRNLPAALATYSPVPYEQVLGEADWLDSSWTRVAPRRVGLSGDEEEPLIVQYAGDLGALALRLEQEGWQKAPAWTVRSAAGFIEGQTSAEILPALPRTHYGRYAALVMIRNSNSPDKNDDIRQVLRLWPTSFVIKRGNGVTPLYAGGIISEEILHPLGEFSAPKTEQAAPPASRNPFLQLPGATARQRPDGSAVTLVPALPAAAQ